MKFSKIKIQMVKEKDFEYNSKTIKTAKDIVKVVNNIEELEKATEENTLLICLNVKNQIVAYTEIAKGTISSCAIDMKSIFKTILLSNACKFIMIHNHPSGNPEASKSDYDITRRIKETAQIMDVQFLDHIIVADDKFVSCMI